MTVPRASLYVDEGTLQALKWIALLLMFVDHGNKYLALGKIDWMFAAGRACLPLFCFVLAYNLSRPGVLESGGFMRVMKRTVLAGWIATPFFIVLGGLGWGWWPLNIMFMLFVAAWIMFLLERRQLPYKPPEVVFVKDYSGVRDEAMIKRVQAIGKRRFYLRNRLA